MVLKWLAGLSALGVLSGCSMLKLQDDLDELNQHVVIQGKVQCEEPLEDIILVGLWGIDDDDFGGYWLTRCDGDFSFLRKSGRYYLLAFADANEDGRYQPTEWGAVYPGIIEVQSGRAYQDLVVNLLPPGQVKIPPEIEFAREQDVAERFSYRDAMAGQVTTLDDPLFTEENGTMGLWTPLSFSYEIGVRIYFLQAYDPERIPVLFVHGAGGYPGTWRTLIQYLDQETYQPWVAFYPSGMDLDVLGGIYSQLLDELRLLHSFEEIVVVAHSMGGLVSRSMIQNYNQLKQRAELPVFISFASPWNGHAGVRAGIKHAPAAIPSWYDMVPDSEFITQLAQTADPAEMEHYLFFAYDGKSSVGPRQVNNDGAVSIRSQLYVPIQNRAEKVIGIDAGHVGILSHPQSVKQFNEILKR